MKPLRNLNWEQKYPFLNGSWAPVQKALSKGQNYVFLLGHTYPPVALGLS